MNQVNLMKSSRKKACVVKFCTPGQFRTEGRGVVLLGSVVYKALGLMLPITSLLHPCLRFRVSFCSPGPGKQNCMHLACSNHTPATKVTLTVALSRSFHCYQMRSKLEVLPCQSQASLGSTLTGTSMFLNTQAFSDFQPNAMPQAGMVSLQVSIFNCHSLTKPLKLSSNASFSIKVFPHTPPPSTAAPEFPPTLCWPFSHN